MGSSLMRNWTVPGHLVVLVFVTSKSTKTPNVVIPIEGQEYLPPSDNELPVLATTPIYPPPYAAPAGSHAPHTPAADPAHDKDKTGSQADTVIEDAESDSSEEGDQEERDEWGGMEGGSGEWCLVMD
ncbi:hypothetical protein FRC06_005451 [Ceratobasidium sp. 370]|nr:hypothetical protein FRC06_005451 [Ceratobasidium sp. 370]